MFVSESFAGVILFSDLFNQRSVLSMVSSPADDSVSQSADINSICIFNRNTNFFLITNGEPDVFDGEVALHWQTPSKR